MKTSQQQGVAIISVLIIVAVVSGLATQISIKQQRFIQTSGYMLDYQKKILLALSVEAWAKNLLTQDLKANEYDSLNDVWANDLDNTKLDNNVLSGEIIDEQGKINLNNLTSPEKTNLLAQINRLFDVLELPKKLIDALIDYLDTNSTDYSTNGAENDYYTNLENPYHIANRAMVDLSELRLVKGFTNQVINVLTPFVWVGNVSVNTVNVNTASDKVLMTLGEKMDEKMIKKILTKRNEEGFKSIDEFAEFTKAQGVDRTLLGISSQYFLLESQVNSEQSGFEMRSYIYRQNNKKPFVRITRRII